MLGLANAWCRKLEEEEMKEEKERRKRKRTKKRMKRMKRRTKRTKRTKRTNKRKRRGGEGGGGGGESVENLVRGDSFKAKAEAKPKQSKIHKTRRQAGGFFLVTEWFITGWSFASKSRSSILGFMPTTLGQCRYFLLSNVFLSTVEPAR